IIENPKDCTKKLLELINEFSKVAGYKINIQKLSISFLYTKSKQVEFEIENTIPFTLAPPKMKHLGINLTKYVKDLYAENHKNDEQNQRTK
uniref:Reverse transcriptase domain-containing protein n=1 Tax=Rhinolophus ferrumequinum TaxID=59479 RepID=A0A671F4T8_RHIFE